MREQTVHLVTHKLKK